MQQPPVILPRKRILVLVAEEPYAVGVFELFDRCRILTPEPSVIKLNGPLIFVPAADE